MSQTLLSIYNNLSQCFITRNLKTRVTGFNQFFERQFNDNRTNITFYNKSDEESDPWLVQRPTLFIHDQEPLMYSAQQEQWQRLHFKFTNFDQRFFLLHSEKNSKELDKLCNELNVIPIYWFSNAALACEWYQSSFWIPASSTGLKYKFSSFNRLISFQRVYRPVLCAMLEDIVDKKHLRLSCSVIDPAGQVHISQQDISKLPAHHKKLLERYNGRSQAVQYNMKPSDIGEDGHIKNFSFDPNDDYFKTTFCHVITETLYYDSTLHLTEKSFRPIVNRRPFILAGPAGSLEYLRSYGFKTFSDYWDESYDEETDPHARLDKIGKVISTLNLLDIDAMEKMLQDMEQILEHNYNHFYNQFPYIIRKELFDNIDSAIATAKTMPKHGWLLQRLNQVNDDFVKRLVDHEGPLPADKDYSKVYDEQQLGINESTDTNLKRFLIRYIGASKDDDKASLLAKIDQILS